MKTPLQELLETFQEFNKGFEPTLHLPLVISLTRSLLKKEKEVMCEFARFVKWAESSANYGLMTTEELYNEFLIF